MHIRFMVFFSLGVCLISLSFYQFLTFQSETTKKKTQKRTKKREFQPTSTVIVSITCFGLAFVCLISPIKSHDVVIIIDAKALYVFDTMFGSFILFMLLLLLFAVDEIHMKPFLIDGDILLTLFNMHMCVDISIFRDGSAGIHQH